MTEYARGDDRLAMLRAAAVDPAPLLYRWVNSADSTNGVSDVTCSLREGQMYVRVTGVGPDGPIDWGEVPATPYLDITLTGGGRSAADPVSDSGQPTPHYADDSACDVGPVFQATYDHGFMRVHLQGRINTGILVLAFFNEFNDDSGRYSYFNREVFIR